jgi:FeS assembly SUF system regulator
MLRISKMTDYGTLVLAHLAGDGRRLSSASEVSAVTGLGGATVSKILKTLSRAGLVTSTRGSQGGYALARDAIDITAAEIIDAFDGPVAITDCAAGAENCELESVCGVGTAWQKINLAIRRSLEDISLADLQRSQDIPAVFPLTRIPTRSRNARLDPPAPSKGSHS